MDQTIHFRGLSPSAEDERSIFSFRVVSLCLFFRSFDFHIQSTFVRRLISCQRCSVQRPRPIFVFYAFTCIWWIECRLNILMFFICFISLFFCDKIICFRGKNVERTKVVFAEWIARSFANFKRNFIYISIFLVCRQLFREQKIP